MPTYEYRCKACGTTHEILHGANDPRPTACPSCGGQLMRIFHPVGLVFKGSGFYKTDSAGKSSHKVPSETGAPAKSEGATSEGTATPKAEPAKTDSAKTESKPAAPKPDAKPSGGT